MSASIKSPLKTYKRNKKRKNLDAISPKNAFEELGHLNLTKSPPNGVPKSPMAQYAISEGRSSMGGAFLESQGSFPKIPNVSIVITTPDGAPKSPELLPIGKNIFSMFNI